MYQLAIEFTTEFDSIEAQDKFIEELREFIAARQGIDTEEVSFDNLENI